MGVIPFDFAMFKPNDMKISNCCDAPPTTEYDADNLGHCSECGEGAVFYNREDK